MYIQFMGYGALPITVGKAWWQMLLSAHCCGRRGPVISDQQPGSREVKQEPELGYTSEAHSLPSPALSYPVSPSSPYFLAVP